MVELSSAQAKQVFAGFGLSDVVSAPFGAATKVGNVALSPKKAITGDPSGGANTKGGQRKAQKGKGK